MVEQSMVRTAVLGVIVCVVLHVAFNKYSSSSKKSTDDDDGESAANEESENLNPWRARWIVNRIGFHLKEVNPCLVRHIDKLLPPDTCWYTRVLVPLCGKTVDMAYFVEKGATEVVGIEGIRQAVLEFIQEQPQLDISSTSTTTSSNGFEIFRGPNVSLYKGDFFDMIHNNNNNENNNDDTLGIGKFGAIFDRGSLVAIDPIMRGKYIKIIGQLIEPKGRILLSTVERQGNDVEAVKKGPPFSISEASVKEMFGVLDWVDSISLLDSKDQLLNNPSEADKEKFAGLDHLFELTFMIQAK